MNQRTDEAKRFKQFRIAENLTQSELGLKIGRSTSWISKAEQGERKIPLDVVNKMHQAFNMSLEWFFLGKGPRKTQEKERNLLKLTTDLENKIDLLTQKMENMDKVLRKLVRDFYSKD